MERLVAYAKGLGLSVRILPEVPGLGEAGTYEVSGDGTAELTVYTHKRQSRLEVVLTLIHEIGHHLDYVHKFRRLESFVGVVEAEAEGRYEDILKTEIAGTKYWRRIYTDTACSFPVWRLYLAMEFDIWQYVFLRDTGKYPTRAQRRRKRMQLTREHKEGV